MTYPVFIRKKIINYYKEKKVTIYETALKFNVSARSIQTWLKNLIPKTTRDRVGSKICLKLLDQHCIDHPNLILKERAKYFNCSIHGVYKALKKNKSHKKKSQLLSSKKR